MSEFVRSGFRRYVPLEGVDAVTVLCWWKTMV